MTTVAFFPNGTSPRRITLAEIDAAVSARLGLTRVAGNAQPACFNRQIAMYLAKHVGRWSTTVIGRFYNGRDHSTVCHGIQRIEFLRESNPDVDALVTELKRQLALNDLKKAVTKSQMKMPLPSIDQKLASRSSLIWLPNGCARTWKSA